MNLLQPSVFVLFGATGDLAHRKILPALYNLYLAGELPDRWTLLCLGRHALDEAQLATQYRDSVARFSRGGPRITERWNSFVSGIRYLRVDLQAQQSYDSMAERIGAIAREWNHAPEVIYYLALPPQLFTLVTEGLGRAGLSLDRERSRIVLEKPLGRDLESFRTINAELRRYFEESQIFRIDHYLGKETVQNILALRFGNPMFEPVWNRQFVDHVTITVAEREGIGERGGYYEQAGALRDMVQNHLMQLLCLVAMEPPSIYTAEQLRNRKMDVMQAIAPISADEVARVAVRGQYGTGQLEDKLLRAYREEPEVASGSTVETYAALKLSVENWRWQGVPFYLRSGKRLAEDCSEIAIRFRRVPHCFFPNCVGLNQQPAELLFEIKPNQGVALHFAAKVPGYNLVLQTMDLRFSYEQVFGRAIPEAYETLLREVLRGDPTLFMRADQVEAAWELLQPVQLAWAEEKAAFPNYAAGTWGPPEGEQLLASDGRAWRYPLA